MEDFGGIAEFRNFQEVLQINLGCGDLLRTFRTI